MLSTQNRSASLDESSPHRQLQGTVLVALTVFAVLLGLGLRGQALTTRRAAADAQASAIAGRLQLQAHHTARLALEHDGLAARSSSETNALSERTDELKRGVASLVEQLERTRESESETARTWDVLVQASESLEKVNTVTVELGDAVQALLANVGDSAEVRARQQTIVRAADALVLDLREVEKRLLAIDSAHTQAVAEDAMTLFVILLIALALIVLLVIRPVIRVVEAQHNTVLVAAREREQLAMVAESSNNAVILTDLYGKIAWVNNGFTRLSGHSSADVVGEAVEGYLFSSRTDPNTAEQIRLAIRERRTFRGEVRNQVFGGQEQRQQLLVQPMSDAEGAMTGYLAVQLDVTQDAEQRERFATIISSLSEGVILADATGLIVEANEAACRILALTAEQLVGRTSISDEWETVNTNGSPLRAHERPAAMTLRTGESIQGHEHGVRVGDSIRWLRVNCVPVRSADGEPTGVVTSFSDITEARQHQNRLSVIVGAVGIGLWDWDIVTGRMTFDGRWESMLEYEPGELVPLVDTWQQMLHPDDNERVQAALDQHLAGNTEEYSVEFRMQCKSGRWQWVMANGRVLERGVSGAPLRMAGVHVDLNEQQASRELQLSERSVLASSEQRFRALINNIPGLSYRRRAEVNGAFEFLSDAALGVTGYDAATFIGSDNHTFEALVPEQFRAEVNAVVAMAIASHSAFNVEYQIVHADGSLRWVSETGQVVMHSAGDEGPGYIDGSIFDITARRQAEDETIAARRDAESALAEVAALRGALDQHSVLSVSDATGHMLDVNSAFCQISGYSREELIGASNRILNAAVHPPEFWADVWATVASGTPWRGEVCNRHKNGSVYWVDSTIIPHLQADGTVDRYVTIRFDITAQKAAEAELIAARESLEEAQSLAQMGNWTYDLTTGVIEWSRQVSALFGYAMHDATPDFASHLSDYTPESAAALQLALERAAVRGTPYSLLLETQHGRSLAHYVRGEGRVRRDAGGNVTAMFGTFTDVTAAVEREAQLQDATKHAREMALQAEQANVAKSEFLANMSHEIRTPLTAILGYTDLVRDELARNRFSWVVPSSLETIRRAGEHLLTVINDILDISKIEAGRMQVELVESNLPQLLMEVDSLMRARAADKGVTLTTRLLSAVPDRVLTDPTRLRQILMNIVGNAAKFTDHGAIEVNVLATAESRLLISVTDTGPGMTDEQAGSLFSPFTQADASVTRRFGGTGLGLTICRRLASLMGGAVRLASTQPGRGTTFEIELPLVSAADATLVTSLDAIMPAESHVPSADGSLAGVRILLAEDGPDNQRLISHHLERAGAIVTVAENGRVALNALDAALELDQPFNLIITDVQMPEMDGYTLARTVRGRAIAVPIIALTAHAMEEDRSKCLDAGCDDYATKPIDRARLIATCARWVVTGSEDADLIFPQTSSADSAPSVLESNLALDPEMTDLVREFVGKLDARIEAIATAHREQDGEQLARLAHQLKGTGASYGFPLLSSAARELEFCAMDADTIPERLAHSVESLLGICRAIQRGSIHDHSALM